MKESVLLKIKGKDTNFTAKIPLWRAYLILADIEKYKDDESKYLLAFKKKR